ncbi:MAG TPA: flagellar motor protein MotB [Syntrophorhabdaceae bacterium]|nr:flagellar motor protein MotB [Syntrophorhabdaceae bacterium]HNT69231.1 flagellar motor protein MotB [Syntrophorhabdaceae bacterium]
MMDDHNTPVRIIVKKKKGHSGHHGGAWKVAYADFVTAMMALFIVLWIVGQSSNVKGAIAAYFKEPGVFKHTTNRTGGIFDGSSGPIPAKTETITGELEKLKLEGKRIEDAIAATPAFDKFKDKIEIQVTKDGLRIELLENSTGLFFDIGSARIKPETVQLLKLVAKEVGRLPNQIIIEGYTDARPYVTPNYSNWELSTDRANMARKILEENGVKKDQVIGVRGFADRNLKIPEKPLDFANRRVSILVEVQKQTAPDPNQKAQDPPKPGKK